jgi:hypothetical protein
MAKWSFSLDDIIGYATPYNSGVWITWGGMGFHLDDVCSEMQEAILNGRI